MLKKISLRWRLTLMSSFLIVTCCIGLSIMLNFSAYRMADSIDAIPLLPAQNANDIFNSKNIPGQMLPSMPAANTREAKHNFLTESLLYTIIAVIIGGFLTYYISGKALQPVKALNEQVKNINSHNLSESLEVPPTKDEIAELTESFNEMTDKLNDAFLTQRRFSANAAHELRTPLTILQTKLDVFRKKKQYTPEEYQALTAAFQKQTTRLRSLVAELLDIANMEDAFEQENIALHKLLKDVLEELSPVAKEKEITLSFNNFENHVWGNPNLLYRMFYNLIENAIKYNFPNGSVTVDIYTNSDDSVAVAISDTGIGIPAPLKKEVFEPFYRVDKSRSREMGGAGLGLSLVDTLLKKHGGTISVTDNKGGGTCFTVVLPNL